MYIYIYIYTRVCLCTYTHREDRRIWSEVATILSGSDPTVLSETLSPNTITTYYHQILSQLRSQLAPRILGRAGTFEKWKLS